MTARRLKPCGGRTHDAIFTFFSPAQSKIYSSRTYPRLNNTFTCFLLHIPLDLLLDKWIEDLPPPLGRVDRDPHPRKEDARDLRGRASVLALDLQETLLQSPGHEGRRRSLLFRVLKAVDEELQPRIGGADRHYDRGLEFE